MCIWPLSLAFRMYVGMKPRWFMEGGEGTREFTKTTSQVRD